MIFTKEEIEVWNNELDKTPLPEGKYHGAIVKAEIRENFDKTKSINIRLKITEGAYIGKTQNIWLSISNPKTIWKAKQQLGFLGLGDSKLEELPVKIAQAVGLGVRFQISQYNGKNQAEIFGVEDVSPAVEDISF